MEWRKLIQGGEIFTTGLTSNELSGNFAGDSAIHVPKTTDPAAIAKFSQFGLTPGQPFPNNTIPAGLIDPNAALLVKSGIFPAANAGIITRPPRPYPPTCGKIVRIDHQFTDKLSLMGDFIYDSSANQYATTLWGNSTYPSIGTLLTAPSYSSVVRLTESISPTVVNEVSFNFNGNQLNIVPTGLYSNRPASVRHRFSTITS